MTNDTEMIRILKENESMLAKASTLIINKDHDLAHSEVASVIFSLRILEDELLKKSGKNVKW